MHIILLKFGDNKAAAPHFMAAHNQWIAQGFDDGVFECVGSLDIGGGFILAANEDHEAIVRRVAQDPFVENAIVTPEVHEISVNRSSGKWAQFF